MNKRELFLSCRNGDIQRIRYLVEQKNVELNTRDKWDSTPLYYACLCGHFEIVKYLLEKGARCNANTFDGERCLHGALSVKIRNLLRTFEIVSSKIKRRDIYNEFFRRCLENDTYKDVIFVVQNEHVHVHSCILAARCVYFHSNFTGKWKNLKTIHTDYSMEISSAFRALIQYLYTGILETNINDKDYCIMLSKEFGLAKLVQAIEDEVKQKVKQSTSLLIEPESCTADLQKDFGIFAEQALCPILGNQVQINNQLFADLYIKVHDHVFACHKVFMCGRSDYLKAFVSYHFSEVQQQTENKGSVIVLNDITPDIFSHILHYIYTNTAELSPDNVFDVLHASNICILPGLTKQCGAIIGQNLTNENVVEVLKFARLYDLPRLETQCTEYMAEHLEQIIESNEFQKLVLCDAHEVHERQETDTISVIDDIRYHITSSLTYIVNKKLVLIDELLKKLELDA